MKNLNEGGRKFGKKKMMGWLQKSVCALRHIVIVVSASHVKAVFSF